MKIKSCYTLHLSPVKIAIADVCDYYEMGAMITRINVPESHRGFFFGTNLLCKILSDADSVGETLFLEPAAAGGLTQEQLEAWYKRHGFYWWNGIMRRKSKKGA